MGDRGNVCFVEKNGGIMYFYTHWGRSKLLGTLRNALKRGVDRWNDEPYLARIIFSEMIKDEILSETGYGLSTTKGDGDITFIIDMKNRSIRCGDGEEVSFQDFVL